MAMGMPIVFGAGVAALLLGGLALASSNANAAPVGGGGGGGGGGGSSPPAVKKYTVVAGDSMSAIAQKCTGNGSRFSELLAVNPTKPTTYQYHDLKTGTWPMYDSPPDALGFDPSVIAFVGKVFKTLTPGEVINVPASWGCGK